MVIKKKELTYTIEIATDVLPVYNKENKGLVGYTGCITVKNLEIKPLNINLVKKY